MTTFVPRVGNHVQVFVPDDTTTTVKVRPGRIVTVGDGVLDVLDADKETTYTGISPYVPGDPRDAITYIPA